MTSIWSQWMPFKKVVKNLPVNAGDVRDVGSIPGSRRSPGGGHGNPSQYSCLVIPQTEEPGGLQSTDLQSGTQRKELSMHACTENEEEPSRNRGQPVWRVWSEWWLAIGPGVVGEPVHGLQWSRSQIMQGPAGHGSSSNLTLWALWSHCKSLGKTVT